MKMDEKAGENDLELLFSKILSNHATGIELELALQYKIELINSLSNYDPPDSRTVLLRQQMMNEWSFMIGLSSSIAATIRKVLGSISSDDS